jgi:pimeloyl-ACP methyl ester carboxylesterase
MAREESAGSLPQRGSLQAGGTRLSYLDWGGGGDPLLLLHGITSNARTWWRVGPALAALGFRVVALDMPGHGHSGEAADHGLDAMAQLVGAACRELGLRRTTLVGHSWGGAIALELAAHGKGPDVDRLVLMDPALSLTAEIGKTRVPVFSKGIGAPMEELVPAIAAANPDWHPQDVQWKAEAMLQCRPGAVSGFFTQSGDWNITADFARVKAPLLLLVADPVASIIDSETLAAAERSMDASRASMTVVRGTTHNMYRGSGYEPTMAVVTDWLGRR